MTKNVDERIVKMQFDNNQFEKGIGTTLKSLDNLKSGLNFDGAIKNLGNLERAGRSFSLEGIGQGVDLIASRFTALGIVGVTALANIANSALYAGKQLVSSLTVDPIITGFHEYETKMGAIQTILTNTASKGTTLQQINDALNELNIYSDKTIYNFAEMAKNIGTFTAAGIDLKKSTMSIKGIANLAAGSGSTPEQASVAMYQLSQALAAGRVSLMDWNSVVNAGMGGELFQNALKKTAKEMGVFVDESKPFRLTLEEGWLTSDTLTKTLSGFADDPMLVKAATQVKTFTQLLNTMRESVQSGWAQSWENIIGNKEEAASFFTAINDGFGSIVGASADARNETLAFWKANGGRDAIIQALTSAFTGLQSILKPIGEAFREVFPKMTGKRLVEISVGIRDLMANFKIGEKTAENLKNTFKGLFALLDIGKQLFTAVSGAFFSIIKFMLPVGDSLLSVTGTFSGFIVAIDEALKSSNAFTAVIKALGGIIEPVAKGIRAAVIAMVDALASLGVVDTTALDSLGQRIQARLDPLEKLGIFMEGLVSIFYNLASMIGNAFAKMREFIANSFGTPDFKSIFDIINGGLIAGILYNIQRFTSSLGQITGILNSVRGCLEAYQTSLKASALMRIAIAMGILSAALVALSLIDSSKLTVALAAMTGMFVDLFAAMAAFEWLTGGVGFIAMIRLTTGMIGLSVAILILAGAMKKLTELDWGGVSKGLIALAGMSAILIASAKALSASSGMMIRSSVGFILFATAINVLARAVEKMGALNTGDLTKGLIGIGVLVTELALFMRATNLSKMGILNSAGILVFAASLNVLAMAVKKLSDIEPKALVKGLAGMAVMLLEIVVFTKRLGNPAGIVSTAIGLTIMGGALLLIAEAIVKISNIPWPDIGRGLFTMVGALAAITIALNFLPKNSFIQSLALLDIAGSMMMLANALKAMGAMSWDQIERALTAMSVSLGIIVGTFVLLKRFGSLADSSTFVIMAISIMVLATALKTLGSMSLPQIGGALIALAGALAIIGAAAIFLTPLVPAILALSGAITLFGVGVALIGGGVLALSTGLAALAVSGTAASVALVAMVTGLIGLIPYALQTLAQGLVDFARVLGNGVPVIAEAAIKIVEAIIKTIVTLIPDVVNALYKLLTTILQTMSDYLPQMIDAGMHIILGLLKGIADHIGEIAATAVEIVVNFINGVTSMIPKVIQAGFDFILAFINGLAEAIRGNTEPLISAVENLMDSFVDAGTKVLVGSIDDFTDVGKNVVKGFINGMESMIGSVGSTAGGLANSVIASARGVLGIHSPSTVFDEKIGQMVGAGMGQGITKSGTKAVSATKKVSRAVVDTAKEAFDKSVAWIDDRKYYNQLSLEQELAAWERLQKRYIQGTEERKKADREVYRVQKELNRAGFDASVDWISDRKYYNELSLDDELAAWKRVQKRYLEGTKEREEADKEIYRVQKEINDRRKQLEDDYYAKAKEINEKLISDIESVNREYDDALKARTDSLYSAYNLFDKVETAKPVSGDRLIKNLQGQVKAFESWKKNIDELARKGLDQDLLTELRNMGPQSAAQIEAINKMSADKLDTYVSLWRTKHADAKTEAISELESMRIETESKIRKLTSDAEDELSKLQLDWATATGSLRTNTETEFTTMGTNIKTTVTTLRTDTEKEVSTLADNIQGIMKKPDWSSLGANIVEGIKQGIISRSPGLAIEAANMALMALNSAKMTLGIHSPSKAFTQLGMYAGEGFIIGLRNVSGVATSAKDMGNIAMNSLKKAISNMVNIINGDLDLAPTIRPVLDLTNIEAGRRTLNGMFDIDGNIRGRIASMVADFKPGGSQSLDELMAVISDLLKGKDNPNGGFPSFEGLFKDTVFQIRDDDDIRKIAKEVSYELYHMTEGFSRGRGLVTR